MGKLKVSEFDKIIRILTYFTEFLRIVGKILKNCLSEYHLLNKYCSSDRNAIDSFMYGHEHICL